MNIDWNLLWNIHKVRYALKQHRKQNYIPKYIKFCNHYLASLSGHSRYLHRHPKIRICTCIYCQHLHLRPVVPGCAMAHLAQPDFGRSVNPISKRGTDYAHLITTGTPGFSDLPTALSCSKITTAWVQIFRQKLNGFFSHASHQIMI